MGAIVIGWLLLSTIVDCHTLRAIVAIDLSCAALCVLVVIDGSARALARRWLLAIHD
jgi:hypothetical protein